MANSKKTFSIPKEYLLLVSAVLFLLVLAGILRGRIAHVTEENLRNLGMLNQVSSGFNDQTLDAFKQNIDQLEAGLLTFIYALDPPDKEIRKDYDLPIYFVDDLSKVKQSLKAKSAEKKVTYPEFGFKESLPDEKEAKYLIEQLSVIKDIVDKGMDEGINFSVVSPLPAEDLGISPGVKLAKTRLEFTASAAALINFLIQESDAVPLYPVDYILVKSQDSFFKADMTVSHIVIEADWRNKSLTLTPLNLKEVFSQDERVISSLRANNPLSGALMRQAPAESKKAPAEESKQAPRFLYQGKAVLRSKEVAVVEDTLNQETLFLAPGDRVGDFALQELDEAQITLKSINTGQQMVIKRQGQ